MAGRGHDLDRPFKAEGGLAILRGSLAPDGAVLKVSAATPALLRHRGRACVFRNLADLAARVDDPALPVTPDSVLVLQNAGPVGGPGMPEAGSLPIPRKLLAAGVRDMVRVSDARMSGTAGGTVVLHVAPEAAVGGPLAHVRDGDEVLLDAEARRLDLLVPDAELARRRAAWQPPASVPDRGYRRLFGERVLQAPRAATSTSWSPRPRSSPEPPVNRRVGRGPQEPHRQRVRARGDSPRRWRGTAGASRGPRSGRTPRSRGAAEEQEEGEQRDRGPACLGRQLGRPGLERRVERDVAEPEHDDRDGEPRGIDWPP